MSNLEENQGKKSSKHASIGKEKKKKRGGHITDFKEEHKQIKAFQNQLTKTKRPEKDIQSKS